MASLIRALSTRPRNTPSPDVDIARRLSKTNSLKRQQPTLSVMQISAPIFLSTTNMHSYNAPDIVPTQKLRKVSSVSSNSSRNTDKESDTSSIPSRSRGASVTDSSSIGSSPPSPSVGDSPGGFSPVRKAKSSFELNDSSRLSQALPPLPIPSRAPTHSKVAHEQLARKRSLQTLSTASTSSVQRSPPRSVPTEDSRREARSSVEIFRSHQITSQHPFGKELRQLDEIAEEFNGTVRSVTDAADAEVMEGRGLVRFCADDYMQDLQPLWVHYFMPQPVMVGWL